MNLNNIINLRLAHSAYVGHENNYGQRVLALNPPVVPTFLGSPAHPDRPKEQYDTWRFFVTFKFGFSRTETFYDTRARSLWAEWKRIQFSKTIKRKSKSNGNHSRIRTATPSDTQLALI